MRPGAGNTDVLSGVIERKCYFDGAAIARLSYSDRPKQADVKKAATAAWKPVGSAYLSAALVKLSAKKASSGKARWLM